MSMHASVVMLTKNPGEIFVRALAAALGQKTPWPFEVLVIDSGSRDGTVEHIQNHSNARLLCIKPEEFGHGKTRNLAFAHTTGEFVAFLTHDATPVDENWLTELVRAVELAPDVAGAFGRHRAYENASPFTKRDMDGHFDNFARLEPVLRIDDWDRYRREESYRQLLHFFSDNNSCLRRSVWEKIPYPDVDFAEDQLWAKQALEAGYARAYADRAIVYHSHDFGIWEQLRRSFDEGAALKRLFGYKVVSSVGAVVKHTVAMSLNDLRHARRQHLGFHGWPWVARSPFLNFSRLLGYYLGQSADRLPDSFVRTLSRDKAMQRGQR